MKIREKVKHLLQYYCNWDLVYGSKGLGSDANIYSFRPIKQVDIKNTKICGYIRPDGTYYQCSNLDHLRLIKDLIEMDKTLYSLFQDWYINETNKEDITRVSESIMSNDGVLKTVKEERVSETYGSIFDSFVIKVFGWIKVGAYPENIGKDDVHYMLCYDGQNLTPKQTEIVYLR